MTHEVPWNKIILERFVELALLTPEEEMVLRTRVGGWTITRQSIELNLSPSTVSRIIRKLKEKYDECAKYDALLPPRRFTVGNMYLLEKQEEIE